MKRLTIFVIVALMAIVMLAGCGREDMRSEDGRIVIDLPEGTKLVNISKHGNTGRCEYTYRKRHDNESIEEYVYIDGLDYIIVREH